MIIVAPGTKSRMLLALWIFAIPVTGINLIAGSQRPRGSPRPSKIVRVSHGPAISSIPDADAPTRSSVPIALAATFWWAVVAAEPAGAAAPSLSLPPQTPTTKLAPPRPSPFGSFSLGNSNAFRLLTRDPPLSQAERRLRDVTELQDERLDSCADRGPYWEQCFMFGMRDDAKGIDYQWGSPEASLEPPMKLGRPPTW
mmetsp:Transcript_1946/g.4187  ORF Transcript_1946/g.4187 Transcript_1946/m.4187 type:complete len:198 (+) Transcript_1946:91-684(+)